MAKKKTAHRRVSKKEAQVAAVSLSRATPQSLTSISQEDASKAGRELAARRRAGMTQAQRSAQASHAVKCYWDGMSYDERQIEMKRRVAIAKKGRRDRRREKIRAGK